MKVICHLKPWRKPNVERKKNLSTTFSKNIFQECEGEIKTFSNEEQLREFLVSKPAYQEQLNEIPQMGDVIPDVSLEVQKAMNI